MASAMSVQILIGDSRQVLATLPDQSVDCCATSPPYFGLRDYGVAGQMGLEQTPAEYIAGMVALFREVWRVLRNDGTLWLNIGDSYASTPKGNPGARGNINGGKRDTAETDAGSCALDKSRLPGIKTKDLIGIPWMLAFALRDEGWYLRQDIIWSKPNPMPESIRDRCTKAHEYLFLFSKRPRYYFDQKAIAEPSTDHTPGNVTHKGAIAFEAGDEKHRTKAGLVAYCDRVRKQKAPAGWDTGTGAPGSFHKDGRAQEVEYLAASERKRQAGQQHKQTELGQQLGGYLGSNEGYATRNKRSVWEVATQPFAEAHFATYPPALIEPCILAGCRKGGTVLDPFGGAGTTGLVADRLQRNAILIELNPEYADIARRRIDRDRGGLLDAMEAAE
jgi:DNA modification methylase